MAGKRVSPVVERCTAAILFFGSIVHIHDLLSRVRSTAISYSLVKSKCKGESKLFFAGTQLELGALRHVPRLAMPIERVKAFDLS